MHTIRVTFKRMPQWWDTIINIQMGNYKTVYITDSICLSLANKIWFDRTILLNVREFETRSNGGYLS